MSRNSEEFREVENRLANRLNSNQIGRVKNMHQTLATRAPVKCKISEESGNYIVVSYSPKGRMIPEDVEALQSFCNQVRENIEFAEVFEENIMFKEEVLIKYKV